MAPMWRLATIALSLWWCAVCAMAARDLTENASPSAIAVPSDHRYKLQQEVYAKGYQHYRFKAGSWVLENATAKLYNGQKKEVGRHFFLPRADASGGQPTWESVPMHGRGVPHSLVTCKAVAGEVVDPRSIQWVLLKSTRATGDRSFFGQVAFVQRTNTKMGLAPPGTNGAAEGDVWRSAYTCNYLFYVKA